MSPDPEAFHLRIDDELLARSADLYGPDPSARLQALGQALVTSPPWESLADSARLVVRSGPAPALAVVGRFRPADRPLLEALGWQVQDSLRRLRAVPYVQVERLCAVLAERLTDRLGAERLRAATVVAVPRGGLVVAGLLAYALGLTHDQLDPSGRQRQAPGELVVVDDCVLSGARTRRWLAAHDGPPAVLAHLHSHPDLRRALEQDPRVAACVAASDLHDHAPELQGDRYPAWRSAWAERSPDDFWTGHPDHVVYPWNEPDTLVWNGVDGTAEAGWHVVPPASCLKNRARPSDEVQVCTSAHVPAGVLWARSGDAVVLVDGERGRCVELRGSAADVWLGLVETGDAGATADAVAERYGVQRSVVLADVDAVADTLRDGGWWRPGAGVAGG